MSVHDDFLANGNCDCMNMFLEEVFGKGLRKRYWTGKTSNYELAQFVWSVQSVNFGKKICVMMANGIYQLDIPLLMNVTFLLKTIYWFKFKKLLMWSLKP